MNTNEKGLSLVKKTGYQMVEEVFTKDEIRAYKELYFRGASDAQMKVGLGIAAEFGLSFPKKEIFWDIKLGLMISRDGYKADAMKKDDFIKITSGPIFETSIIEEMDFDTGEISVKLTPKCLVADKPITCWAVVHKKGGVKILRIARWNEYGKTGGAWQYKVTLLCKCAESLALRAAYSVTGGKPADEMNYQENEMLNVTPERDSAMALETDDTIAKEVEAEIMEPPKTPSVAIEQTILMLSKEVIKKADRAKWHEIIAEIHGEACSITDLSKEEKPKVAEAAKAFLDS